MREGRPRADLILIESENEQLAVSARPRKTAHRCTLLQCRLLPLDRLADAFFGAVDMLLQQLDRLRLVAR